MGYMENPFDNPIGMILPKGAGRFGMVLSIELRFWYWELEKQIGPSYLSLYVKTGLDRINDPFNVVDLMFEIAGRA